MAFYVCALDSKMKGNESEVSWDMYDTKGSSIILKMGDNSVFIPKKHVREDRNGNKTVFINTEWEYSKCNSHFDEVNQKYVREPITHVKGNEILACIQCYSIYIRLVTFNNKDVKHDDFTPF